MPFIVMNKGKQLDSRQLQPCFTLPSHLLLPPFTMEMTLGLHIMVSASTYSVHSSGVRREGDSFPPRPKEVWKNPLSLKKKKN